MLRASAHRNDMTAEGEVTYPSIGQFRTLFITSARLSPVTRSTSTSEWRLITPGEAIVIERDIAENLLTAVQDLRDDLPELLLALGVASHG